MRARALAMAAKRLNAAAAPAFRRRAPMSLGFLTDHTRVTHSDVILRALPPGSAVIFRDYADPKRRARAHKMASLCRRYGLLFYVGADLSLAYETRADGLHAPSWMAHHLTQKPASLKLSIACHNEQDFHAAARLQAESVFLSPVFATKSHPGSAYLEVDAFLRLAAKSPAPVLALGGVSLFNAGRLKNAKVVGFGAIGAFA